MKKIRLPEHLFEDNFTDLVQEFTKFDNEDLWDIEEFGQTMIEEYTYQDFNYYYIKLFKFALSE